MPIEVGINLTKQAILERITEEQIFEYYLGYEVDEERFFVNPLRPDKRPGCRFYRNNKGRLYFHDFGKYHWDCFAVVQYRYGLTFFEALRKISKDFTLKEIEAKYFKQYENVVIKEREKIQIARRDWNNADINFWKQGNITLDILTHFEVYPCKAIWVNGELYKIREDDPCYAYYFHNELFKLYFPKRKENRFFQNINVLTDDLTQGWNKLPDIGDHLIITKSYKDVMSLCSLGVTADSVLSEYHVIKSEKIKDYKLRFNTIFTLFDNDHTGRRLAIKYWKLYQIPYLVYPSTWAKDTFDNISKFGVDKMQELINNFKEGRI